MEAGTIARLATLNGPLLKDLPLADVLEFHPLLDGASLEYIKVKKVKSLKARPISTLLISESVMSKIVLATLEGHEAIKVNAYVCWGVDNDVWQQTEKNLHAKYTPTHVDADGWIHFDPKPDVPIDAAQVTEASGNLGPTGGFSIINPSWGDERVMDDKQVFLQYGVVGDYVLRGVSDVKDTYRVAQKFFNNTYSPA